MAGARISRVLGGTLEDSDTQAHRASAQSGVQRVSLFPGCSLFSPLPSSCSPYQTALPSKASPRGETRKLDWSVLSSLKHIIQFGTWVLKMQDAIIHPEYKSISF